jgi:hypothetical protein
VWHMHMGMTTWSWKVRSDTNEAWLARIMVGEVRGTCEMGPMGSEDDDATGKGKCGVL